MTDHFTEHEEEERSQPLSMLAQFGISADQITEKKWDEERKKKHDEEKSTSQSFASREK